MSNTKSTLVQIIVLFFPWKIRRTLLRLTLGFEIAPTAHIGKSIVNAKRLMMGEKAKIGHLTYVKGLERLELSENSTIGNLNWITGFPLNSTSEFFKNSFGRHPSLHLAAHAAITNRHLIDCTDSVQIGEFATFAGFRSQILTHSINIFSGKQECHPVQIGTYSFVGTGTIILPGSILPPYSILGAGAVLASKFEEPCALYGGVPAKLVKHLPPDAAYFLRTQGRVV